VDPRSRIRLAGSTCAVSPSPSGSVGSGSARRVERRGILTRRSAETLSIAITP